MYLLFGIWETPLTSYYIQYWGVGLLGFCLCWFRRWMVIPIFALIVFLVFRDFSEMTTSSVGPRFGSPYFAEICFSIVGSVILTIAGYLLGQPKVREVLEP